MARPLPPPSPVPDDDEVVPDSELEFEDLEDAIQNESSDDSDDDFVPGESSQSDVPLDQESDVPLRLSMTTPSIPVRPSSSKAGPSFKISRRRGSAAKMQSEVESSDPSDSDDSDVVRKKAPRRKQTTPAKSGGRRGAVLPRRAPGPRRRRGRRSESDESDQEPDTSDDLLAPSDDDTPPPKGLDPEQIRSMIKAAERRMRKKLGHKLSVVRPPTVRLESPWVDNCFLLSAREGDRTTPPLPPRTQELLGRSQEVHCRCHPREGGTAQELAGNSFAVPAGKFTLDEETGVRTLVRRNPGRECACGDCVLHVLTPFDRRTRWGWVRRSK